MAKDSVHIKCRLDGELAVMYRELKTRGLVKSAGDAVGRGVQLLYDEALERDMKRVRVSAAERLER